MFTGIIEATGRVASLTTTPAGGRLELTGVPFADALAVGESVAVNGCCLTVTEATQAAVRFDLLAETLRVTNLGALQPGGLVNLERAMAAGGRFSGHYVQGHVDATARVLDFTPVGQDHRLEVELPAEFARSVIHRGSITVDGISLTVAELSAGSFTCWIIPHTAAVTNLAGAGRETRLNLEFDLIGKYVARWFEKA